MADLAWFLVALDRYDEAIEVASFVAERVTFQGDYDIWSPACRAILCGPYCLRHLGRSNGLMEQFAGALANSSTDFSNDDYRLWVLESARRKLDSSGLPMSAQMRDAVLTDIRRLVAYLEPTVAGTKGTENFAIEPMETLMRELLALLRRCIT